MRLLLAFLLLPALCEAQYISHGPVIGAVTDSSCKIFVRCPASDMVELQYATDSSFSSPRSVQVPVDAANDSTAIIKLSNLEAFTRYFYRFNIGGKTDERHGFFTTFPTENTSAHFTLVTGSCQETDNMKVFKRMAELEPLLFLHSGDFTYPSYQLNDSYPANYQTVVQSWHRKYEEKRMHRMLYKVPIDYVNDDDDGYGTEQNYWLNTRYKKEGSKIINYITVDTLPVAGRYNVNKAYSNLFPHYQLPDTANGLYHNYRVGNVEVFFLDSRANAAPYNEAFVYDEKSNNWSFAPDSSHRILGRAQMNWLKSSLKKSDAQWKIIVSGVPFNKSLKKLVDFGLMFQNYELPYGKSTATGFKLATSFAAYWAGYPQSQRELLSFVKVHSIENVLFVSGDSHHNVIDDGGNAGLPELNASGMSVTDLSLAFQIDKFSSTMGYAVRDSFWNGGGNGLGNNPNFNNAFGKIEVFGNDSLRLSVVDENGTTIAKTTLFAEVETSARAVKPMHLVVYPNPANDQIYLQMSEDLVNESAILKVVNSSGKVVFQETTRVRSRHTLSVTHLPAGIYQLQLATATKVAFGKFVLVGRQ
ncbi:T9SS type A sorting domain-containing protein [bacterium]|nr:T9SS type A sorting domain-containing protein [bacterium]